MPTQGRDDPHMAAASAILEDAITAALDLGALRTIDAGSRYHGSQAKARPPRFRSPMLNLKNHRSRQVASLLLDNPVNCCFLDKPEIFWTNSATSGAAICALMSMRH